MKYLRMLKVQLVKGEFKNPIKGQVLEPGEMFAVFKDIKDWAKETLIGVYLNDKLEINSYDIHSTGGESSTAIVPEEVFRSAILTRSKYFILIHNHPSGQATPSVEDTAVMNMLREQSKVMNKYFLDFIIVGEKEYWSMFEKLDGETYKLGAIV